MEKITIEAWKTSDGQIWYNKSDAENREQVLQKWRYFLVKYSPDLIEGRHGPNKGVLIAVQAERNHLMFAEWACYELFGNRITFVQGVIGSNAIILNWTIIGEYLDSVDKEMIYAKVYDSRCNNKGLAGVYKC